MDDAEVIKRIGALVDEEHTLERSLGDAGPDEESTDRLREIEVALDQCWDLLRQRRDFTSARHPDGAAHAGDQAKHLLRIRVVRRSEQLLDPFEVLERLPAEIFVQAGRHHEVRARSTISFISRTARSMPTKSA